MFSKLQQYLKEVKIELKKTTWVNRDQIVESTLVVLVTVGISAVLVGILDFIFFRLITFIVK
ncbi:MAG: preprotein translocase subunit SecE [bacterium]